MRKLLVLILFTLSAIGARAQSDSDYTKRLKAIANGSLTFYNVDGVNFSSQTFSNDFSESGLKSLYRKYSIKNTEVKVKDDQLPYENLSVTRTEKVADSLNRIDSYYFVENKDKTVTIISFNYYNTLDRAFERSYVKRIVNDEIPPSVFATTRIDSVDFAGRQVDLPKGSYWTNINSIQCPYQGQMNWSVHEKYESARASIDHQFKATKVKKGNKVISEEEVAVIFEGTPTRAKKVIYDFTGVTSLLAGTSGGKTITVYYVAAAVRGNFVSCVMSFWNNDVKTDSGLAPLLAKVMGIQ